MKSLVVCAVVTLSLCLSRPIWAYGGWLEETPIGGMTLGPARPDLPGLRVIRDQAENITNLCVVGDAAAMNWVHSADGRQYPWIGSRYAWGTGTLKVDGRAVPWARAGRVAEELNLDVVSRLESDGTLYERRTFKNVSDREIALADIDIHTPFNDNFPKSPVDMFDRRAFAHVWAGGSAAWVSAMRMGGQSPHLGLAVVEGWISAYELKERSRAKGGSNTRGIIALSLPDVTLKPGEETTVAWRIFAHEGWDDFFAKLVAFGGVDVKAERYVLRTGEKTTVTARTAAGVRTREWMCPGAGEHRVEIVTSDGRTAFVEILGVDDPTELLKSRARYIVARQQVVAPGTPYDGAFVPYDTETGLQERSWETTLTSDHSEGRERLGMGVFLAKMAQRGMKDELMPSLLRYYRFVRTSLEDPDHTVWQAVKRSSSTRAFNYPWHVWFYLEMYKLMGERTYLADAYQTLKRLFRGDIKLPKALVAFPIGDCLRAFRAAGMPDAERDLIAWGRTFLGPVSAPGGYVAGTEVGLAPEVVSATIHALTEFGSLTGERAYLDAARRWIPRANAVCGRQPSWHCYDIGLHHWDGYWFGKRACWGDTLPHDWNGEMASAFRRYAEAIGEQVFAARAEKIADAMLGLFTPDGRGSCACVYPNRVNGEKAKFFDPLCNDQDWALVFYLDQNPGLSF